MPEENQSTNLQVQQNTGVTHLPAVIIRPPDPSLRLHNIQPHQIDTIERGSSDSKRFTVGIGFFFAAVGFLGSLVTTAFLSTPFFICLSIFLLLGGIGGTLIYVARKDKNELLELAKELRAQLPPPPSGTQIT